MPRWGVHISIDQLGYQRASIRDVVRLAATMNRDTGLLILGTYNLALSLASIKDANAGDQSERLEAQQSLLRNSISKSRLRELKQKLGNAHLLKAPFFHRAQLLTMIKLVAKFGAETGGNRLENRDDFDVIGELGLMTSSLWAGVPEDEDPGDALAPGLSASTEIENPPAVAESVVRADSMLGTHLRASKIHNAFARRVESTFLFSSRLNFEELLDLTFAIWSYYSVLSVKDLVADQKKGHYNPLNPSNTVSGKNLTRILESQ